MTEEPRHDEEEEKEDDEWEPRRKLPEVAIRSDPSHGIAAISERDWLKVSEVADELGLSVKSVRRAIERGSLEAVRLGSVVRVHRDAVSAWTEASKMEPRRTPHDF